MRTGIIILIILVFSFTFQLFGQGSDEAWSPEAGNAYNKGRNQILQKKYNEAITSFKEAIKVDAKFYKAYYMLGYTYKKLGKLTQATDSYKKAIEINIT